MEFHLIKNADVIIIDEYSMFLSGALDHILNTVRLCKGGLSLEHTLLNVAIVFVGDPRQLPPVCPHSRQVITQMHAMYLSFCSSTALLCFTSSTPFPFLQGPCNRCGIQNHHLWSHAIHMRLSVCLRAARDPGFAAFNARDPQTLTQAAIDEAFSMCYWTREEAVASLTEDTVVLCTHREQVPPHILRAVLAVSARLHELCYCALVSAGQCLE
jgi:hypothetical protein